MVTIKMKVGPKGQVVIPKVLREEKKIFPGDEVVFDSFDRGVLIEKPPKDIIADFERVAKKANLKKTLHPHEAYEGSLKERTK